MVVALGISMPAYSQVYLYTGGNPMAKMMLDFMEVMGFIHRLPDRYATNALRGKGYNGWSGFPTSSLWGMSPYSGMSTLAAPLAMSSMMSQPGMGGWPMPGNMTGAMMPLNSLNYPTFSQPSTAGRNSTLQPENGKIQISVEELQSLLANNRKRPADSTAFAKSPSLSSTLQGNRTGKTDEVGNRGTGSVLNDSTSGRSLPAKPDELAGLWMGSGRDILTITADRFVWTDPKGRVTQGSFRIQGDMMLVQADEASAPAEYKISYSGDEMVATNKAGYRYKFTRAK